MKEIHVIDNFFHENVAEYYHNLVFNNKSWNADYNKNQKGFSVKERWNWHRTQDHNDLHNNTVDAKTLDEPEQFFIELILDKIYELEEMEHKCVRYYMNAHTYGIDGPIHRDDGDVTAIWYPNKDWDPEWEGGTAFYDNDKDCIKYVGVKFNRLILFPASIYHRAMPLTRECYKLRVSMVMKTAIDVNSPAYAEWYNKRK